MALLGWRINKWLGAALTLFTGLIVIGSVALGWHYAVDAIAGNRARADASGHRGAA